MGYRYLSTEHVAAMRSRLDDASATARDVAAVVRRTSRAAGVDLSAEVVRLERVSDWALDWRWELLHRQFTIAGEDHVSPCPPQLLWLGELRDEQLYEGSYVGRYLSALMSPPGRGDDEALAIELRDLRRQSHRLREAFERARHIRTTIGAWRGQHDLSDDLESRLDTGDLEQFLARTGRGSKAEIEDLLQHLPDDERRIALAMLVEHASQLGYGQDAVERTYLAEVWEPVVDAALDDLEALLASGLVSREDLVHGLTVLNGDRELAADEIALIFGETLVLGDELEHGVMDTSGSTLAEVLAQNGSATRDTVGAVYPPAGTAQAALDLSANVLEGDAEGAADVAVETVVDMVVDEVTPPGLETVVVGARVGRAGEGFTTRLEVLLAERARRRRREGEDRDEDGDDDGCDVSPRPPSPAGATPPR